MPPFDPTAVKYLTVRTVGGNAPNSAALAPKIGPMGLNPGKLAKDIAAKTADYRGIRVTAVMRVQNRQAEVSVAINAASLVIRALKEDPVDRKAVKGILHNGNLSIQDIYGVARELRKAEKSMARKFTGTVMEVLGTCVSVGCTVEDASPKVIQARIRAGELSVPSE